MPISYPSSDGTVRFLSVVPPWGSALTPASGSQQASQGSSGKICFGQSHPASQSPMETQNDTHAVQLYRLRGVNTQSGLATRSLSQDESCCWHFLGSGHQLTNVTHQNSRALTCASPFLPTFAWWLLPCTYNIASAPDGGQQGFTVKAKWLQFGNPFVAL